MTDQLHPNEGIAARGYHGGAVRQTNTRDVDEQAALLRGWNQTYNQMSPGAFSGSFMEADLGELQLFREVTSNSLHQTGALPRGTCALGIPVGMKGNATFCGTACDGTQLHIFSGETGFEFYSPEGLDIVGIVIPEALLMTALSLRDVEHFSPGSDAHLRRTSQRCGRQLRETSLGVLSVLAETDDVIARLAMIEPMVRDLTSALADAIAGDEDDCGLRIAQGKRWQIVRRAVAFAKEEADATVTVEDLCAAAGVSRRALQYCFNDILGVTPAAYLRAVRLNGARRSLKACHSVTEAAALWGFWHFGRFAADYAAMFGELPSATARRHHPQVSPRETVARI